MNTMKLQLMSILFALSPFLSLSQNPILYDYTAYTECKLRPEEPLYNGGIIPYDSTQIISSTPFSVSNRVILSPLLIFHNLSVATVYSFSTWVRIERANSTLVTARLIRGNDQDECVGTVLAHKGCWSFLKGGFVQEESSTSSIMYFQSSDDSLEISSSSLQSFTADEWEAIQQLVIDTKRKQQAMIQVIDSEGQRLEGVNVSVSQMSADFPFGSAIAKTIINNSQYQEWFIERFNAAVFENELKWTATEPEQGKINYTTADQMLQFVRKNKIIARGHNIFWEDPKYIPSWVLNLTGSGLRSAVSERIESLMSKYREEFIHWDVSNEILHFDFYEKRLGSDATLSFYQTAHKADPLATLFLNEFNVIESCSDTSSTADALVAKIKQLEKGGATNNGIGLEGHFSKPNPPLIRAVLDKLGTLGLPIWLTEVDISHKFDPSSQAIYLEQVLREAFSHPAVDGIMLWTALHPGGCYQMCLTDIHMKNLATGDVVDKLISKWRTPHMVDSETDEHGSYSFNGFLGEYIVTIQTGNRTTNSTLRLSNGSETKHFTIQM